MDSETVESSGKKDETSGKKAKSSGKEAVSKKRSGEKLNEESVKIQKLEEDTERAELKLCLEIAPNDDKAINIEPLATKSPIVDWETQILREELFYYQIKRANGSSKVYKVLYAMLNDFDRQDLIDLYRLQVDHECEMAYELLQAKQDGKLDFEDVYFVKELKFNLFNVSQMCNKKNSVLFTDTECVVLSSDFKLTNKSHVLLKVPRNDNMYSVDLK
ncbi:hypothetical protein Tco_0107531, partial [Tanacetum coccineum]